MTGWDFDLEIKPTPRLGSSAARSSLFSGCKLFIYWGNGHHGPWFFLVSFTLQPTVLCATGLSRSVPEVLLSNSLGSILLLGAFVRNFCGNVIVIVVVSGKEWLRLLLLLPLFAHTDTVTTVDALLSFVWLQMHGYGYRLGNGKGNVAGLLIIGYWLLVLPFNSRQAATSDGKKEIIFPHENIPRQVVGSGRVATWSG